MHTNFSNKQNLMPIKVLIACIILATLVFLSGCDEIKKSLSSYEDVTVHLPAGNKLMSADVNGSAYCFVYQPMDSSDQPKKSVLKVNYITNGGERKFIFIETK